MKYELIQYPFVSSPNQTTIIKRQILKNEENKQTFAWKVLSGLVDGLRNFSKLGLGHGSVQPAARTSPMRIANNLSPVTSSASLSWPFRVHLCTPLSMVYVFYNLRRLYSLNTVSCNKMSTVSPNCAYRSNLSAQGLHHFSIRQACSSSQTSNAYLDPANRSSYHNSHSEEHFHRHKGDAFADRGSYML